MLTKCQVLKGTACRTPEYLRILNTLLSGSSKIEKTSLQAECENTKSQKSQSQLGCSIKQYGQYLTPPKQKFRSKARKRKTTFARPTSATSATDMDEDSAMDDSLQSHSNQKATVESYSISVGQEGVTSIFQLSYIKNETGLKKKVSIDMFLAEKDNKSSFEQSLNDDHSTRTEKCSKSDSLEKAKSSCELADTATNLDTSGKDENQFLSETLTKSSISSSKTKIKGTTESSTSTKEYSTRLSSEKDLIQRHMRRLERNYRHCVTGFGLGFKAERILNAVHDGTSIFFLIKYRDVDEPELVPSHIARSHIPRMVFQYYDQRFCWLQRQTNVRGKEVLC